MNIGLAYAIFKNLEGNERSDEEKMKAIALVADMATKNSVPKTDCIKAIKYLLSKVETWIPIKTRQLTEEEQNEYGNEYEFMYDCLLPDDGEDVLITDRYGNVEIDTFCRDDNCYFENNCDNGDVIAWRHKTKPYKAESEDTK